MVGITLYPNLFFQNGEPQVLLPPPSVSELQITTEAAAVSFTVFALANSEPDLNCSICRQPEAQQKPVGKVMG